MGLRALFRSRMRKIIGRLTGMTPAKPFLATVPKPLLACLLLAVILGGVFFTYGQRSIVPFHTIIWGGYASGYTQAQNFVINDQAAWSKVWTLAFCSSPNPCPDVPVVNFASRTVLAVFMGQKPILGYQINITQVSRIGPNVLVAIDATVPAQTCGGLTALVFPSHIVDIQKTNAKVFFNAKTLIKSC